MAGPLSGLTIVELAGIGPGPMCSMMLGDMGADVIRVDRTKSHVMDRLADPKFAVHNRSRRSVSVDLQKKEGVEVVLRLIEKADGMTEPFRPGVAERLGVGPDVCLERNPKLVYGRMTGWGQEGPLAKAAGHDINYIALTGALHAIGGKDKPVPPLNLVGDFGGGGMLLAFGMVCGLLEAQRSGKGQVVDAAMVDGAALLLGGIYGMAGAGLWNDDEREREHARRRRAISTAPTRPRTASSSRSARSSRSSTTCCSRRPASRARRCRRRWTARPGSSSRAGWSTSSATKTRDEWCTIMEGTDICFAPVLTMKEASQHPHAKARNAYVDVQGFAQPAAAPRFSRTKESVKGPAAKRGQHTDEILLRARLLVEGNRRAEGRRHRRRAVMFISLGARHSKRACRVIAKIAPLAWRAARR